MTSRTLWQRASIATGLIIALVVMFVVAGNVPQASFAQENGTAMVYGEVVEGHLDTNGSSTYYFDATEGDIVRVDVLAFNFVPDLELQTANQASVLEDDANPDDQQTVYVQSTPLTAGRYYLVVTGDAAGMGHFALSVNKVEHTFPEATLLEGGQTVNAEVFLPVVYSFTGDAENALVLTVRSLTDGYRPLVALYGGQGETLASVIAPRFLSSIFIIEPGQQEYQLVIQKGKFEGSANVEVSLSGGAIGLTEAPTEGCYITSTSRINIREGGSADHAVIAVLGEGRYLLVTGFNPENGLWYQVQLPDGRLGWVASDIVTLGGACENLLQVEYPPVATTEPTAEATTEGTVEPTVEGTLEPTMEGTFSTSESTLEPTVDGTVQPTLDPTRKGTEMPTSFPLTPTDNPKDPTQTN